ncbi:DUF5316 domain-containing protein [Brevibacillus marinus]|uniref:DUF5316 domain-containing protein n=1 Tax=Brevibacillus marinus TaxID=2496837 RepID=UPI0013DF9006
MKRSLLLGFSILLITAICSLVAHNLWITVTISGIIGVVCILLSAIFTGALTSGDRLRANHATETSEDRRIRVNWAFKLALVGLPNLVAAILILLFSSKGQ